MEADQRDLERRYWAFISYRHADNKEEGRQWASWLHQQLETYEVPADLVGKTNERGEEIPSRIFPVFRDEEELGAGNLTERIFKALDNSKVLVVLCSPRTLESDYVREEIRYFKQIGKADHVYVALLEGDPSQSFPETLRFDVDDQGIVDPAKEVEPLAADFRLPDGVQGWTTPEAYRQALSKEAGLSKGEISKRVTAYSSRRDLAKLKLIAGILGVPLGTLQKRDKEYQLKLSRRRARTLRLWLGAVGLMAAAAIWKTGESRRQRDEARRNEAQGWMLRAEVAEKEGKQYPSSLLYAARAIGFDGLGREEKSGMTPYDYLGDFFPLVSRPDLTPRLWRSWVDTDDYQRARDWINDRPSYLPVWSSEPRELPITGLSLSPEGRYLAISSEDGSIRLWDFASDEEPPVIDGGFEMVFDIDFNPDGKRMALAGGGKVRVWNRESEAVEWESKASVSAVAYNASGQILAGALQDGSILLWKDGEASTIDLGVDRPASRIIFSPDDGALAAVFPGVGVRLIFHHYGEPHLSWAEHPEQDVTAVAFSPDGKKVVLGSAAGEVSLWETANARLHGRIVPQQRHNGPVLDLDFRHDGQHIVSSSADGTFKLWTVDVNRPGIEATMVGHKGEVRRVRYVPGGNLIASAGADGTAKLWNVSGQKGTELELHPYLAKEWYGFDDHNRASWRAGSGFLNLPEDSLVGLWVEQNGRGGFDRLLKTRNWAGAALVARDAERKQLAEELKREAAVAASEKQLHLARLRREQIIASGEESGEAGLVPEVLEGRPEFKNGEGIVMIWCPIGQFTMGSAIGQSHAKPHQVTLSKGFWLAETEVTQTQYQAVMGSNPSIGKSSGPTAPVENISWDEAIDFCRELTNRERSRGAIPTGWEYSLPTEAQWEFACRANTTSVWSFGNRISDLSRYGNFNVSSGDPFAPGQAHDDGHSNTAPVGSFAPNPWGFYDMHGNVQEWCRDSMALDRLGSSNPFEDTLKEARYPEGPVTDPLVTEGQLRVHRGGSFSCSARQCGSAYRDADQKELRRDNLGLRPALVYISVYAVQ